MTRSKPPQKDASAPAAPSVQHRTMLALFGGLTVLFLGAAALTFWLDSFTALAEGRELRKRPSALHEIPQSINLTITETGIAAVTTEDLRPFNWQLANISYDTINLTRRGRQIPYFIADDGQALFFLAEAVTSTVTAPAVYQLSLGQGLPMVQRDAAASGRGSNRGMFRQVWEENSTFLADISSSDPWVGRLLLASQSLSYPLSNIQPSGGRGRLSISVWSSTASTSNPDHHLQVSLNGRELADWVWDGIQYKQLNLELPEGLLRPDGRNVLTLTSPGDLATAGEAIYVDRIELVYEGLLTDRQGQTWFASSASIITIKDAAPDLLVFDVTEREAPVALTRLSTAGQDILFAGHGSNGRYFALNEAEAIRPELANGGAAKQALRQPDRGADYIVIYPDDPMMLERLRPLLAHRSAQGLRVTAVSINQVYAEFSHGQPDPKAIHSFLTYARKRWTGPPPRYVLLAGDASYDVHNYLQAKNMNLLPAGLVHLPDGYASSDAWYALGEDGKPHLAIGRLPAQTPDQLSVMVEKILAYELGDLPEWTDRALFVSGEESSFNQFSARLSDLAADGGYDIMALQIGEEAKVRYSLMGALARGVGLINYAGDGYVSQWGDGQIFAASDAPMLANSGNTPIFTTFTCNNGAFSEPARDSLVENLLWVKNGGIVAAIAPSTNSASAALTPLADLVYAELLDEGVTTVGEALLRAQTAAASNPELEDAILIVNLLGDPALRLQRP